MHKCVTKIAAETFKTAQITKQDENVKHILSNYDLLAGEAHYHYSCYKLFTKHVPTAKERNEEEINVRDNEADVLEKFMEYIRTDIFERKEAVTMAKVYEIYSNLLQQNYVVGDSRYNYMKKKVKSLIEKEGEIIDRKRIQR